MTSTTKGKKKRTEKSPLLFKEFRFGLDLEMEGSIQVYLKFEPGVYFGCNE